MLAVEPSSNALGDTNAEYVLISMLEYPTEFCNVEKTPQPAFARFLKNFSTNIGVAC